MHSTSTTPVNREGTNALLIAIGASAAAAFVAVQLGGCVSASASHQQEEAMFAANDAYEAVVFDDVATDGWYDDFAPMVVRDDAPDTQSAMQASMFTSFTAQHSQAEELTGRVSQMSFATVGEDFDPDIDPSGSFMVYASTQHNHNADLYRKDINGRTTTQLTNDAAEDVMPEISPDGSKVAFASDRSGNWDVYVMDVEGGLAVQITFDAAHELHPTWSPDGTSMAYCRFNDRSNQWELWTIDVENPSVRHFVCEGMFPRWCPDRSTDQLLFQRSRKRGEHLYGIWVIEIREGNGVNPTEIVAAGEAATMHPAWSKDGMMIAYTHVNSPHQNAAGMPETAEIWCVGIDGTGHTALTSGGFRNMRPTWGDDGRVYFSSNRGGLDTIWSVHAANMVGFSPPEMASVNLDN